MIETKGRKSPLVPFFFLAHVPFFSTCSFPVPTTISSFCYQEKWKGKVSTGEQLLLSVPTCKACNAACMLYSLSPSLVRCPRTALGPLLVPRAAQHTLAAVLANKQPSFHCVAGGLAILICCTVQGSTFSQGPSMPFRPLHGGGRRRR